VSDSFLCPNCGGTTHLYERASGHKYRNCATCRANLSDEGQLLQRIIIKNEDTVNNDLLDDRSINNGDVPLRWEGEDEDDSDDLIIDLAWQPDPPPDDFYPTVEQDACAIKKAKERGAYLAEKREKFAALREKEPVLSDLPPLRSCSPASAGSKIPSHLRGVYRYRHCNEIVYIGKGRVIKRLGASGRKEWEFDEVEYTTHDAADEQLYRWEAILLAQYANLYDKLPRYNKNLGHVRQLYKEIERLHRKVDQLTRESREIID